MVRRAVLMVLCMVAVGAMPAAATTVGLPAWDRVTTPTITGPDEFRGVEVIGASNVWAVGTRGSATLTERWNGSSFTVVPSPTVAGVDTVLEDVESSAANDVWVVGHTQFAPPDGPHPFVIRWNGTAWKTVANTCGRYLVDVFALTSTNVWAIGGSTSCHWNGTSWQRIAVAPPTNPQQSINLQGVDGSAAGNVWAVGLLQSSCGEGQVCSSGVIERWNGSRWTFQAVGQPLYDVRALSATNVYAVGMGLGPTVLHFDGSSWEVVPEPSPLAPGSLVAIDAVSATTLWSVGSELQSGAWRTLAERAPSPTSGAVVGGTRVSGATVSWTGPESGSVSTDPFGDYRVGGLNTGTYTFFATNPGCTPSSKSVNVVAGTTIKVDLPIFC